ncbi:CHAT domain-containing protein [Tolypothrix campylonemoides VB511288]|nr:CHAT domain-containing protein [Tolypothrix campylonemoides VB511288]
MLRNLLVNLTRQLARAQKWLAIFVGAINVGVRAAVSFEVHRRFLGQVLVKIIDSDDDPQEVVYSFLEENLNKLNYNLIQVLRIWGTELLTKKTPELSHYIAVDIGSFCRLIQDFPLGNRAINLEIAITGYKVLLNTVLTPEHFLEEWGGTQNNLGNAYLNRIWGVKTENLEEAIRCFSAVLSKLTCEQSQQMWATTQNNLGNAYFYRIREDKAQNLEAAICCWKAALEVFTRPHFPDKWAMIQQNLGNGYANLLEEDPPNNIEQAILYYKAALEEYTREKFPQDWAMTHSNLGNAYTNRLQGNLEENLEEAIKHFELALKEYTREKFPEDWASTQNNMGVTYVSRIRGEPTENLKVAIGCYLNALQEHTCEAFPQYHAQTQFHLGIAYQNALEFTNAYTAFSVAINIVESLRSEIVNGSRIEESKQKLAEEWNNLYQRMVEVCLTLGKHAEALKYAERSKTRNLIELILTRDRYSIFPPEIVTQIEKLRDNIAISQYQLQTATTDEPLALAQHLQQLRQQCNYLQDEHIRIGSSFEFQKFQQTLDDHTAVVEFFIIGDKFLALIFTHQTQQPIVWQSEPKALDKLEIWARGYLRAYNNKRFYWQRRLTTRLHLLAKILHIDEIIRQIPEKCDRLILIPHRFLHLLPLHGLPISLEQGESKSKILMNRFPKGVRYAPSCQLLQLAQTRKRPNFTHLFAIQNPTQDLTYADLEVQAIQSYFNSVKVLEKAAANKAAVNENPLNAFHCAHFSCHGYFNPNPTQGNKSALFLADSKLNPAPTQLDPERHVRLSDGTVLDLDKCLTLDAIFTLNLDQCRLVTLSACETGLIDFRNISDEYIGLVSGFLFAGSPTVISSLWAVDQVSTAFLLIKFYENLKSYLKLNEGDVAVALQNAQYWLQNLTCEEVEQELAKPQYQQVFAQLQEKLSPADFFELEDAIEVQKEKLQRLDPNHKPFANPYYWAAFIATGV